MPSNAARDPGDASDVVEGERFGNLIRLRPEYRERYRALHAHPFPGLIEQMRASNQHNYSIFLLDGLLFSFYEYVGDDLEADMERLTNHPTTQDWWTLTNPMQEPLPQRDPDAWWASMEELFHGGGKTIPSRDTMHRATLSYVREGAADDVRQAYRNAAGELEKALATTPVQNVNVYLLGTWLCTYGEDASRDGDGWHQLQRADPFRELGQTLDPLLDPAGEEDEKRRAMESVFYMP